VAIKRTARQEPTDTLRFAGAELPRWVAVAAAVILLLVAVAAVYYSFRMWGIGGTQPQVFSTPTPAPAQAAYAKSRLLSDYPIDSTPILVFNCNMKRTGTWALREQSYEVPPGTERQDLINALCSVSNRTAFCGQAAQISVPPGQPVPLGRPGCEAEDGAILVYAFYGPNCPASIAQRQVLEMLSVEYPDDVQVRYICVPLQPGDEGSCRSQIIAGQFDE